MGLRSAPGEVASDVDDVLDDVDPALRRVDTPDLERREFTPAQAGVGEDEDDGTEVVSTGGERVHLPMREVRALLAQLAGKGHAFSRVLDQPPVADRVRQDHAEHVVRPADSRRSPGACEARHPLLDVGVGHVRRMDVTPPRQYVERTPRGREGLRCRRRVGVQPGP